MIVPSIWWENSPLVIQEAFHARPPGDLQRHRRDGREGDRRVNGLHFRAGDPTSLAATMRRAATEPDLWERLRGGIRPVYRHGRARAALPRSTRSCSTTARPPMSAEPRTAPRRAPRPPAIANGAASAGHIEALTLLGGSCALALTAGLPVAAGGLRGWLLDGERRRRLAVDRRSPSRRTARPRSLLLGGGRRPLRAPVTERPVETGAGASIEPASVAQAMSRPTDFGKRRCARSTPTCAHSCLSAPSPRAARSAGMLADAARRAGGAARRARERLPARRRRRRRRRAPAHVDGFWRWTTRRSRSRAGRYDGGRQLSVAAAVSPGGRARRAAGRRLPPQPAGHRQALRRSPATRAARPHRVLRAARAEPPSRTAGCSRCERAGGEALEVEVPPAIARPAPLRATILGDIEHDARRRRAAAATRRIPR